MVKTRVHDLAAEFGVAPEQLLGMLKDMNIFVRSHLSALESDQVSAVRVRWEREKRQAAPKSPRAKKGRRKAVQGRSPRRSPREAKPTKRRRTAAEVAQVEAQAQAEKAAELAALELERPMIVELEEPSPTQTLEERARAPVQGSAARAGRSRARDRRRNDEPAAESRAAARRGPAPA